MTVKHVVVDGSNLATEGRTLPSLQQLDEAVRSFVDEFSPAAVTVVVDASFPNRIDASERDTFEEAITAGEMISPPAGVIGRGDAFLLQIADRAGAVVLSNDSFQEFHGQYGWLFDQGRLVGGKPVPHVGWVFMDRSPVRGPLSRRSVSDAKKTAAKKVPAKAAPAKAAPAKAPAGRTPKRGANDAARRAARTKVAQPAALAASEGGRVRQRRSGGGGASRVQPYNEALPFIEFVGAHPVGTMVSGEIERFASHGAYVMADGARCYLPLAHMADPPPRSAREALSMGRPYEFVVHAFDTPRRGVDLTMPGVVVVSAGDPAAVTSAGDPVHQTNKEARVAPAKKAAKKAVKRKAPAKKAAVKRAPARKAPARKAVARKSPAKKAAVKRAPARKAPAKKKAVAKKAVAKKAPARKAPARKAPAKKKAVAKKATKATKRR